MMFNAAEQEAIVLSAVWGLIDEMVNFAIFMPLDDSTKDTNLLPKSGNALRLFNVFIDDFLSPLVRKGRAGLPFELPAPPTGAPSSDLTLLFYLRRVCACPQLARDPSGLTGPVEGFGAWLEEMSFVEKIWLPSIDVETDLRI